MTKVATNNERIILQGNFAPFLNVILHVLLKIGETLYDFLLSKNYSENYIRKTKILKSEEIMQSKVVTATKRKGHFYTVLL